MTKMKKVYQKPEIEILELELNSIIATSISSDDNDGPIGNGGESGGGMEAESNRHRGEWGNLWAED